MYSDILSGILSGILFGNLSGMCEVQGHSKATPQVPDPAMWHQVQSIPKPPDLKGCPL